MKKLILLVLLSVFNSVSAADELRIAVASNFVQVLKKISQEFEKSSDHRVKISSGSTGKHYAQIKNGAPFDLFFAADSERPVLLEQEGRIIADSRFTYARGKLVLWSPLPQQVDSAGTVLEQGDFNYLALANPRLAPYGRAAKQLLDEKGLWKKLSGRMVQGENIGQTFQFVKTGNADLGLVALSQVIDASGEIEGSFWHVPQDRYAPIDQQAVLLKDKPAARAFIAFVKSDQMRSLIQRSGYETP
ncbi:MAG: molybdate ABC transporter substrate-binding protein [Gammaproteobacteria bacterium]|nr:molybdate ABC transporter substrate-binding protein [Gammaproteobacteria bacterium]